MKLDYPVEFLASIYGYYGRTSEWGPILIRSLTFISNRKSYGPFGVEHGTCFSFPMTNGKIVGFHGKSGWYLDAIGVHLKPIQKQNPSKAFVQTQHYITNETTQNVSGYDIILAVRQKDDISSKPPPQNQFSFNKHLSDSGESNDRGKKEKVRL